MAECLNVLFQTVADKLSKNFPTSEPIRTETVKNQPKFQFQDTNEAEIEKLIRNLSLATSIGTDRISPRILKAAVTPLLILLCKLVNKSLNKGVFPDDLKVARVSPIYKSGDRTDPGNYRPISVLPTVSKIYE